MKATQLQMFRMPPFLQTIFRAGLVVAAVSALWPSLRRRNTQKWAMAATNGEDRVQASLTGLDSLFGDDGAKDKDNAATASRPEAQQPTAGGLEVSKAKSTLQNLKDLFGDDAEEAPPKKEEPAASSSVAAEKPPPSIDDKAKKASDDLYKRLGDIRNEKDVEDIRLQTKELVDLVTDRPFERRVPPDDVRRMRDEVLTKAAFYLGSSEDAREFIRTGFVGGHLFRGHFRGDSAPAIKEVERLTKEVFQGKYDLLVLPEPPKYDEFLGLEESTQPGDAEKPAFMLIAPAEVEEKPFSVLQYVICGLAAMAAFFTTYTTAVGVGLSTIDTSALQGLLDADNTNGLEDLLNMNMGTISSLAFPVCAGIIASAVAHEVAQRVAAAKNGVKLGLPYFLPSLSIGTFGTVTRLRSFTANFAALFDIAASGPIAGASSALVFFAAGLALSVNAAPGDPSLVPIPEGLIASSLVLGDLVKAVLGQGPVMAHPFLLAGWCALIANALNTLPLGSTDGGRVMQAAFGRAAKQATSLVAYICLALDFLAPGLGFTWGITTIFLQRGSERYVRDQFTPLDTPRKAVAIAMFVLAVLVLVPSPSGLFPPDLPVIE